MRLHSTIDIITNSSSEIFIGPIKNAVHYFHDSVNKLLKGHEVKSEDLFDVSIKVDWLAVEEYYYEDMTTEECEKFEKLSPEEQDKLVKTDGLAAFLDYYYSSYVLSGLDFDAKIKEGAVFPVDIPIYKIIMGCIDIEEYENY